MLNGIDPVIIFQFSKVNRFDVGSDIPVVADLLTFIDEPPIPIYLSEKITGLFIDSEDKNVDIQTDFETKTSGGEADVKQRGASSTVAIQLRARKSSLGLSLLSAMIDSVFDKVTSEEYTITYLHGPVTIFRGLIQSYSATQNADSDLLFIRLEITKGKKNPEKTLEGPTVERNSNLEGLG